VIVFSSIRYQRRRLRIRNMHQSILPKRVYSVYIFNLHKGTHLSSLVQIFSIIHISKHRREAHYTSLQLIKSHPPSNHITYAPLFTKQVRRPTRKHLIYQSVLRGTHPSATALKTLTPPSTISSFPRTNSPLPTFLTPLQFCCNTPTLYPPEGPVCTVSTTAV
jgi:hypothetical protein